MPPRVPKGAPDYLETAAITFPRQLTTAGYQLTLVYSGKINTQAAGLFALAKTSGSVAYSSHSEVPMAAPAE